MIKVFLISIFCFINLGAFAQGYELKFKIDGLADTTFLLGNFFGESTYVKDTAVANANGEFTFTGSEPLEKGMYFLVLNKVRLFDFVVGDDQQFSMTTKHPDYIPKMTIVGDEDNKIFLEDMKFNAARNEEAAPHVKIIQDSLASEEAKKMARAELDKVSAKVDAHVNEIIKNYPNSILATMMKANRRLDIPDAPKLEDGSADSGWQYRYYKTHFWDNFDLGDPTLLRLSQPLYRKKVEEFLDRLIVPNADSIIQAISIMADVVQVHWAFIKHGSLFC